MLTLRRHRKTISVLGVFWTNTDGIALLIRWTMGWWKKWWWIKMTSYRSSWKKLTPADAKFCIMQYCLLRSVIAAVIAGRGISDVASEAWFSNRVFFNISLLSRSKICILKYSFIFLSFLQLVANAILFVSVNLYGVFVRILTERAQRKAFLQARNCIEDRLRLEDENEKQVSF